MDEPGEMIGERNFDFITIVSGLPRSGTSMMMRMLEAGGMPVIADNDRNADADNPNGYYETEAVKKLKEDSSWVGSMAGKALKAIYLLLYELPKDSHYRVLFMRRCLQEVIASQDTMLRRSGASTGNMDKQLLTRHFEAQLNHLDRWLRQQPNMSVIYVDYAEAVYDPAGTAARVAQFLGGCVDPTKMAAAVDSNLYRQHSSPTARKGYCASLCSPPFREERTSPLTVQPAPEAATGTPVRPTWRRAWVGLFWPADPTKRPRRGFASYAGRTEIVVHLALALHFAAPSGRKYRRHHGLNLLCQRFGIFPRRLRLVDQRYQFGLLFAKLWPAQYNRPIFLDCFCVFPERRQ
jgi:Sulfotransferase domain